MEKMFNGASRLSLKWDYMDTFYISIKEKCILWKNNLENMSIKMNLKDEKNSKMN